MKLIVSSKVFGVGMEVCVIGPQLRIIVGLRVAPDQWLTRGNGAEMWMWEASQGIKTLFNFGEEQ